MRYLRYFLIAITAIQAASLFFEGITESTGSRQAAQLVIAIIASLNLFYLITQLPEYYYNREPRPPGRIRSYFSNWLTAKEVELEQRLNKAISQG